ncbi:DUF4199 domain-containing protein [Flavobacterium muglaense]|uniref:DUF4199 domain-containing protein n=1 Tax=Flavobacterium muglaense TaxID=2764716 RepID=A0A923MY11_9FLAO|nr:DUF4199 domain-containing protein [Flavobacterium muglaense]MBC5837230.1 DUF4199 domain-containing protein [Flavobacterium muglaense]MBC5843846.1 DUF4199 domain-containing protein [Flavobacterium muglaense]
MINEIIKKNGLSFGLITGLASIVFTTALYVIDLKLFVSGWVAFASLAIRLVIGIVLLSKTKKELNGIFSYKEAFTTYFISAVIGVFISVFFNIILFNYVDPAAKDTIRDLSAKFLIETLSKFNTPASAINEAVSKLKETDQFSPLELLKGSIFSVLGYAILGLILAAFFKGSASSRE